jgi:uncharacterized protein YdaU (DUF1376 family)
MSSRPYMPLWIGDYLADTAHLPTIGHGAYLLSMMHYWRHGPLPDDPAMLRRIMGLSRVQFSRLWPVLSLFYFLDTISIPIPYQGCSSGIEQVPSKCWRHRRLDAEIEKAEKISMKRQLSGQRGGLVSGFRSNNARRADRAFAEQTGHHHTNRIESSLSSSLSLAAARARGGSSDEGKTTAAPCAPVSERLSVEVEAEPSPKRPHELSRSDLDDAIARKRGDAEQPKPSKRTVAADAGKGDGNRSSWQSRRDAKHDALAELRTYNEARRHSVAEDQAGETIDGPFVDFTPRVVGES